MSIRLSKKSTFVITALLSLLASQFFLGQGLASSLTWFPKRTIGKTIIWKHSSLKDLRASSRLKNSLSILPTISNREKVIKDFEDTKKKALALTGVKEWQAKSYEWQGNERLFVKGSYKDRKGQRITFNEVHLYRPKHRLVVLVTQEKGEKIASKAVNDLIETIIKAESLP